MAHEPHITKKELNELEKGEIDALVSELRDDLESIANGKRAPIFIDTFCCTANSVYVFEHGKRGSNVRYRIDCSEAKENIYSGLGTYYLQLQDNVRKDPKTKHSMTYANVLYPGKNASYTLDDLFEAIIASLEGRVGQCIKV